MQAKVARRYQVTIPEEVREKARISVGDTVDVRYEDGKWFWKSWKTAGRE